MVSIAIAAGCAVWVLWRCLRPFRSHSGTGCDLCDSCTTRQTNSGLLQIGQLDKPSLN